MIGSSELRDAAEMRVGRVLKEKWRLDALIGVGGMAAVYAATHRNGSRVAIKVLHRHFCASEKQVRRFLREAYTANRVGHPGAVPVYDDDIEGGDAFLVMDLLTGTTVKDYAEACGGRLSTVDALRVLDELLDVLKQAHAGGIVHRDIKPSNLFLSTNGGLKVLDFGVARSVARLPDEQSTADGDVIGTPAFMSPEQARGRHELVDARSDIWSVGATMFTLLSGELVHPGATATEHLCLAMSTSARSLRNARPDLPGELIAIVDRCLHYDPEQRFANAASLQEALRTLDLDDAGRPPANTLSEVTPLPLSTLTNTTRPARPRARVALLAAAGTLCIGAVALFGAARLGPSESQRTSSGGSSRREQVPVPMNVRATRASTTPALPGRVSAQRQAAEAKPGPAQPIRTAASASASDRRGTPRSKRPTAVPSSSTHATPVSVPELDALSANPLDKRH